MIRGFFATHALKLAGVGLVAMGALCLWLYIGNLSLEARLARAQAQTIAAVQGHRTFVAQVTAQAAAIRANMAQVAVRVERAQAEITQEVSRDYQARVADLRRRADRLRPGAAAAHPGGGGAGLPGLPHAAGRPDAAAGADRLSLDERVIASEQSIRLEELQRWVREQQAVDRSQMPR